MNIDNKEKIINVFDEAIFQNKLDAEKILRHILKSLSTEQLEKLACDVDLGKNDSEFTHDDYINVASDADSMNAGDIDKSYYDSSGNMYSCYEEYVNAVLGD